MATTATVVFPLFLFGQSFDPGFDPHPPDGFQEIPNEVHAFTDELIYFYRSGETHGRIGIPSQQALVPIDFQRSYADGYKDGQHFYKFLNFF